MFIYLERLIDNELTIKLVSHRYSHSPGDPSGVLPDLESNSPASHSLKLEDMADISDTLQLGIKFFGSKFIADVASGNIALPTASVDLVSEHSPEVNKSENAIVFPDMFDLTAVSGISLKPDHKILWHDRKDKLRKTYMTKKANLTKFCSRIVSKKTMDSENDSQQAVNVRSKKGLRSEDVLCDPSDVSIRRKRGRPPKRLKVFSSLDDSQLGKHASDVEKEVDQNVQKKGNYTENSNAVGVHIFPRCIASVRSLFGNDYSSKRVRGSYRQYTAADKLEIIEFGLKHGSTAASRKYNIPESTVRSWTKKMDTFLMQVKLSETTPQVQVVGIPFDKKDPPASCADFKKNTNSPLNNILDSSPLIKIETLL